MANSEPQSFPEGFRHFAFSERSFCASSGVVRLGYQLDDWQFCETLALPAASSELSAPRRAAVDAALALLHWTAGISYWKAGCPPELSYRGTGPDAWQADWLTDLYWHGLAEFAHRNRIERRAWPRFPADVDHSPAATASGLPRRTLVPMGGGKDSLVAWARLRGLGERPVTVQVGQAPLIGQVARQLGGEHLVIARQVDPGLAELNRQGAWNGHVPITAINAAVLVLVALTQGFDRVVFANERSADAATLTAADGEAVNHQYSKSHAFERRFDEWVRHYVDPQLRVFSLLRRDSELAICRQFAGLERFHATFSSCNRNFHLDGPRTGRWCGRCPKCHFVFLGLAPFLPPARLSAIFGRDLLADPALTEGFAALLDLSGDKPFECVGEADEARAAVRALAGQPAWRDHAVVTALADRLPTDDGPDIESLCRPRGPDLIPDEWRDAAG